MLLSTNVGKNFHPYPCTLPARRSTQLSDEYMAAVARDGEPVVLPGWLQTMVAAFDEAQAS